MQTLKTRGSGYDGSYVFCVFSLVPLSQLSGPFTTTLYRNVSFRKELCGVDGILLIPRFPNTFTDCSVSV